MVRVGSVGGNLDYSKVKNHLWMSVRRINTVSQQSDGKGRC